MTLEKKVLFLVPYPLHIAPSQRFRVEVYFQLLEDQNIEYDVEPFLEADTFTVLYKKSSLLKKANGVFKAYIKRLKLVTGNTNQYDFIFIHREASPLGPPVFEWIIAKIYKKKIIYDFDDAIWIANITEGNHLAKYIKCFWKIKWICKWSHKISVGNVFLGQYAKQFNDRVIYNPTCVDTENRYNKIVCQKVPKITIGWTGSHSTLQFLSEVVPALQTLEQIFQFCFLVICNQKPEIDLKSMEYLPWNKDSEIEDLMRINIGIMPLKADVWSEGKCGFKIIQYLSLGIPAVVSPVGVNKKIIDHGINGFFCNTESEWVEYLSVLLENEDKRTSFGEAGRIKIDTQYSMHSNASNFISLFSD